MPIFTRASTIIALLSALCLATGCGDDDPTGGGGSGGEQSGGSSPGGGGQGVGGSQGGAGGTGGNPECDVFIDNQPPVQTVEVIVTNNTANPIYLGSLQTTCSSDPLYRVESLAGDPVKAFLESCEFTCATLALSGCACPDACFLPQVILIEPGGSFATNWMAVVYDDAAMPADCYADQSCVADTCLDITLPAEDLSFLVDSYATLADCELAECTCDGGLAGSCVVDGATLVSGLATTASATWTNGAGTVDVVFE